MSNVVFIELDTKSPEIEIYAPSYTTSIIHNKIIVESDEVLSDFQNIYVIDRVGQRFDYTFEKSGDNMLIGEIIFNNVSLGIATINVELEDDVGNKSKIFTKIINIKESLDLLLLTIEDNSFNIVDSCESQKVDISESTRKIIA